MRHLTPLLRYAAGLLLAAGCLLPTASSSADSLTQNLFLITLDGVRTQEMFEGADLDLLKAAAKDQPVEETQLYHQYWANTAEERRSKLMPFFWGELMKQHGFIAGNPRLNSHVHLRNRFHFSYPGYSELLTGQAHDQRIRSNDKIQNPYRTVLEFFREKLDLGPNRVAAFASWDVFEAIVTSQPGAVFVNAGFNPYPASDPAIQALNQLQAETSTPWDTVRHDAYTFRFAIHHLQKHKPRILYLALGETDDWAHDQRYDRVLNALALADDYLKQLWQLIATNPHYHGQTTLILTTDHGRGLLPENWAHHNSRIPGCQSIWLAIVSPDSSRRGEWSPSQTLYLDQVAATACQLLDLDHREWNPTAGAPIPLP